MKRYVEVEPICPFIGKPCIRDGWQWDQKIIRPCAFWDEASMNNEEPCLIFRAIKKTLNINADDPDEEQIIVPFETGKGG